MHGIGKRFVYVVRSDVDPQRHYTGITADPDHRIEWHNHGPCGYTTDYRPWSFAVVMEFPTEQDAVRFERYLKWIRPGIRQASPVSSSVIRDMAQTPGPIEVGDDSRLRNYVRDRALRESERQPGGAR